MINKKSIEELDVLLNDKLEVLEGINKKIGDLEMEKFFVMSVYREIYMDKIKVQLEECFSDEMKRELELRFEGKEDDNSEMWDYFVDNLDYEQFVSQNRIKIEKYLGNGEMN